MAVSNVAVRLCRNSVFAGRERLGLCKEFLYKFKVD